MVSTNPEKLPDLYLVANHQPTCVLFRVGKRGSSRYGERRGGGEAIRLEDVGGAELQVIQTRPWLDAYQVRSDLV